MAFMSLLLWATLALKMAASAAVNNETVDENVVRDLSQKAYQTVSSVGVPDWYSSIDNWTSPAKLKKACPWYIMGNDLEGRKVFVWELGNCDFLPILRDATPEEEVDFDKHVAKLMWEMEQTCKNGEDDTAMLILDVRGYTGAQLTNLKVIKHKLLVARVADHVDRCIANPTVINLTFVSQMFFDLIQPISGRFVGRLEKFARREKWEPYLKSKIAKDQLPPFYGGDEGYKPLLA